VEGLSSARLRCVLFLIGRTFRRCILRALKRALAAFNDSTTGEGKIVSVVLLVLVLSAIVAVVYGVVSDAP
jgi:hypothetical protein